ncbi:hypothetical protein KJ039_05670 [bacterium]|nr:hypothetical protein [bacterium]
MPIRVLQHNIIHHFENIRHGIIDEYREWISTGQIKPGIQWRIEKKQIKPPYVKIDTKELVLQEVYLAYVWGITYSLFVIYEEAIQKKMKIREWTGQIDIDTPLLKDAENLFNWALSLVTRYSDWDKSLPNPEIQKNDNEEFYIRRVNGIFLDIVTFNLLHECAHLALNHNACEKNKELEGEADNFALNILIKPGDPEEEKLTKILAIILSYLSNFFAIKGSREVQQNSHPDLDTRLHNALEYLGIDQPQVFDCIWYLACFGCRVFFGINNISVESEEANDSVDLFYRYLGTFDKLKNSK